MKSIIILFLLFFYISTFAQSGKPDSTKTLPKSELSEDKITFVKPQVLPTFKEGVIALEDTLTKFLQKAGISKKTFSTIYHLRIRKDGSVDYATKFEGLKMFPFEKELEAALVSTSGLWAPAMQNNSPVNSMKLLKIIIENRRVSIE